MIKNVLIILVFILSACNNSVQEVEIKEVEKKQIINENLLFFDFELIKDIDVNDEKESELYELDNLQVNYFEDVIYISGLINTNACDSFTGDFKIKDDELLLLFKNNSEEPCMSSSIFKIRVLIKNPSKKKYNVVYKVEN
ncbi:hypothetical protein [Flavobacterium cyclinae]|uniref:hypothetical protein n=1 Tax=Flavobacterium cyclinae TaxID=2895947 RepID=UPI001E4B86BB|nr:hypothetical protein [Flavobacterium cyclinae]UGS22015.1 hypothetical protein LOS86_05185 [Flavobacterium cyclinae]